MEYVEGLPGKGYSEIEDITSDNCDKAHIKTQGMIYKIRDMADFAFIILRKRTGLVQCIYNYSENTVPVSELSEEVRY